MLCKINSKKVFNLISLPNEVVKYINELDETTLKTLILIFSEKKILSKFEISKKLKKSILEIDSAFKQLEYKKIINASQNTPKNINKISKPSVFEIDAKEIKTTLEKQPSTAMLFNEAEKIYARPLNFVEKRVLTYITQAFNLSTDLILMAICFGVKNNKNINQIEQICEDWSTKNILTHEQAEEQIKILTELNSPQIVQIKKYFGIYRPLSTNEKYCLLKWTKTFKFNLKMIKKAYDKCIDSIGRVSVSYINKIMHNWHENNVRTILDLEEFETKHKQKTYTHSHISFKNNKNKIKKEDPNAIYNLKKMKERSKNLIMTELKRLGRI